MKYLVTGATGFIGSTMVERLLQEGSTVRCLVRNQQRIGWLSGLPVELQQGSLFDGDSLHAALDSVDVVLHFAGVTRALRSADYHRINTLGTEQLLTAAAKSPGIKKIVHISSVAAAGPSSGGLALDEESAPHPITPYGRSKLVSEQVVKRFIGDLPIAVIRPPVVYGPRDRSGLSLFESAFKGLHLSISGCNPCFTPMHVDDLVQAVKIAAEDPRSIGRSYFVRGPEAVRAEELFALLAELLQRPPKAPLRIPYPIAWCAVTYLEIRAQIRRTPNKLNYAKLREIREDSWLVSGEKIKKELGFEPRIGLREGFKATLDWYRAQGWLE